VHRSDLVIFSPTSPVGEFLHHGVDAGTCQLLRLRREDQAEQPSPLTTFLDSFQTSLNRLF
jgi:hypothetical protein